MMTAMTEERGRAQWQYWFVLLAGPVGFSVLFLAVYLLNELSCNLDYLLDEVAGLTISSVISLVLTAATLALIAYAGYLAYGIWQARRQQVEGDGQADKTDNRYFIGLFGVLISGLFVLLSLAIGAAVLWLRPC